MIEFVIDKNNVNIVKARCDTSLPVERPVLPFTWDVSAPYAAKLVQIRLQEQMGDKLQAIRLETYDEGYHDGKCHRVKRTWFSRLW